MDVINPGELRQRFSHAMSAMYQQEVPLYGDLLELVQEVNQKTLKQSPQLEQQLRQANLLERISEEKHGAIRLGKAEELSNIRRLFALMAMEPVGYYDLSMAGIPVHSTAFRPVYIEHLATSPFRVFTSLLRTELIADTALRQQAEDLLASREIFSAKLKAMIAAAEAAGGIETSQADTFIAEALQVFCWHKQARVSHELYQQLMASHGLTADIVAFRGPHINHLTPSTLDIDSAQTLMQDRDIKVKQQIEGPPKRRCPILLRQTSFLALNEAVEFPAESGGSGKIIKGQHTARFGEIEQRGIALTPKGYKLYERLMDKVRSGQDDSGTDYQSRLQQVFEAFPDDLSELRQQQLAYFRYRVVHASDLPAAEPKLETLLGSGHIVADPIIYEDFLPVSAAGIFQSNLRQEGGAEHLPDGQKAEFEQALGCEVLDSFALYAAEQKASVEYCSQQLGVRL